MLNRILIRSFKAFGELQDVPLGPFTLIVGPNGAGKTSVLQAIELLGMLVRGTLSQALEQRGWEYKDLIHLRSAASTFGFRANLELDGREYDWVLELGKRRSPGISIEKVTAAPDVELLLRGGRVMERIDERTGEIADSVSQTLTSSWLSAVEDEDANRFPGLVALANWARGVRPYVVLDPSALREPGRAHPEGLGPHGEGLAALLRSLDADRRERAIERAREHYSSLVDVKAIETRSTGSTRLEISEAWGTAPLTLSTSQVSDGLLRLLALSVLHELDDPPSVLMFDEIENGVHPHLLRAIVKMLRSLADSGIQVIATTHSPVAASFVRDAAEVLLVDRDAQGNVEVGRLSDSARWAKLSDAFAPGEAWYALGERALLNG